MAELKSLLETKSQLSKWREDLAPQFRELQFTIYLLRQSPLVVAGFILIFAFIAMAIFAPWITPYGPEERIWEEKLQPPSSQHIFGTDESGGDIFSRIIWASQLDLAIALIVVVSAIAVGSAIGAVSGYIGGKIDEVMMRITDIFLAFPALILAMTIAAALGLSLIHI